MRANSPAYSCFVTSEILKLNLQMSQDIVTISYFLLWLCVTLFPCCLSLSILICWNFWQEGKLQKKLWSLNGEIKRTQFKHRCYAKTGLWMHLNLNCITAVQYNWIYFVSGALLSVVLAQTRQYYFINMSKNWTEAQTFCRQDYTDLATVENPADINAVTSITNYTGEFIIMNTHL